MRCMFNPALFSLIIAWSSGFGCSQSWTAMSVVHIKIRNFFAPTPIGTGGDHSTVKVTAGAVENMNAGKGKFTNPNGHTPVHPLSLVIVAQNGCKMVWWSPQISALSVLYIYHYCLLWFVGCNLNLKTTPP